ncbi:phage tail tape measure protein [Paenibacillus sp. DCT19]|uniref:phage tail tape measure protein n=1 Tax=Paenibacillus sp. DCT19 TaxID=2211212 RepID=UPI000FE1F81D|nr:phage tail tape measure protein [Paenibacillus sp. DCT19]
MAGGIIGNLMFAVGFKLNTKGLDEGNKKISTLTKGVIGLGAAGVTAMAGLGIAGIAAANTYESAMSDIQQATGLAADQMEATREVANNLYNQNFGEDWNDLGSAISTVQQVTGQTGSELESTTQSALLLRDAFGYEINESIKSVDTMMKQFGITSEQAYDLLTQGTQKGLNKSDELMDSANEYANQFKSLGFSAEEMFDVFAAGSAEGVFQLDKVGDAVKEFNIRSKDGSKASVEAFEMLGLNADTMMQTFAKGGPQAKTAFSQILQMISDVEDPVLKNQIGVSLLGTQFEDLEATVVAGMGRATSQFSSTGDALAELNKIKFEKPGEAFAMFSRQIETGILIPIGQKLLPYFNQFGQWMADNKPTIEAVGNAIGDGIGAAVDWTGNAVQFAYDTFNDFIPKILEFKDQAVSTFQDFKKTLEDNQGAIGAVVGIITTLLIPALVSTGVQAMITGARMTGAFLLSKVQIAANAAVMTSQMVLAMVRYVIQGWAVVASITATMIAWTAQKAIMVISTGATWAMTAAQWALNSAFWANPITWIVAAIIAVIIAAIVVFKNWGAIKDWLVAKWQALKAGTISVFQAIGNFIKNMFTGLVTAVTTKATAIWDGIKSIWDRITSFLSGINLFDIGKNIIEGMINGIGSMANAVVDKVKDIGNSITDKIKGILGIHSPSRVMMEVGFFTGEGLARGIENTQDRVSGASANVTDEIIPDVNRQSALAPAKNLAPARATGGGSSQGAAFKFDINIDVKGDSGSASAASDIASEVKRQVQEVIEEAFRRMGLPVPDMEGI